MSKLLIKFRAQTNDGEGGWVYSTDHGLSDFFLGIESGRYNESTLCQFTGLLDEAGEEIYGGDIVCDRWGDVRGVEYKPIRNCGCCFPDAGIGFDLMANPHEDTEIKVKVIGNIYDNKDLLKK